MFSLLFASKTFAVTDDRVELESIKQELEALHDHAALWQYGWTSFFAGSLALQTYTVAAGSTSEAQKFDAKVSLVTSGSGLFSTLFNPLPAAFLEAFNQSPETTPDQQLSKAKLGRRILDDTRLEVDRRRSARFQAFVLSEQLLAAGAIAWIDKRPQDAGRRFLLGVLTSELFIFTTPWQDLRNNSSPVALHLTPNSIVFELNF
jgi:hypothetical protein